MSSHDQPPSDCALAPVGIDSRPEQRTATNNFDHYEWRLHPPLPPMVPFERPAPGKSRANDASSARFNFHLNDHVYIRPKASKELGVVGRIVELVDATKANNGVTTASEVSPSQRSKKRKLVEDIRVSVRPHCFVHTTKDAGAGGECSSFGGTVKRGVRPSRLLPVYDVFNDRDGSASARTLMILTPDTTSYRQLATSHLRPSDKVLEIGCSTGECTVLLMRRLILLHSHRYNTHQVDSTKNNKTSGQIVALDTGHSIIGEARSRLLSEFDQLMPKAHDDGENARRGHLYSQLVQCHKVDALADPKGAYSIAMGSNERKPDMILIDIGGNRELSGIARMIHWVQSAFHDDPPRLIIVKSEALVDELSGSILPKKTEEELLAEDQSAAVNERISTKIIRPSTTENGIISQAQHWFSSLLLSCTDTSEGVKCNETNDATMSVPKYSHPLRAPLVLSPKDNATPICRWHNYDPDGCKRHNGCSDICPYDHTHCHWCRKVGHVALSCRSTLRR